MISWKKIACSMLSLALLFSLPGCTPNEQAVFDAAMKMQKVHSMQEHTTMFFELSGTGFEPTVQKQVDTAAAVLNNAKLDLNAKTSGNEQKTVVKSQVNMDLNAQGISINMPIWVDMDISGKEPKLTEIIKVPQIAAASLPSQFAQKEYMVMNPYNTNNVPMGNIDFAKFMEFNTAYQTKWINFVTSYSQRFSPNLNVTKVSINGDNSVQKYTLKLNDAELKEFISYTVNNFAQDKEAMNFLKDLITTMIEMSKDTDKTKNLSDLDQVFKELDASIPQFLAQFNTVMSQLKNVTFLGDKGLELNYTISDGYITQKSGMINLKIDLAQLNKLGGSLSGQQSAAANSQGALNLTVNFNTDITGINTPIDIQIPEVNKDNSFDYMDYLKVISASHRLAGQDRYRTARAIAEEYNSTKCKNIILVSGTNFPDALSSSILSKKFNAPILLVGPSDEESSEALSYIAAHSDSDTKIYIIGGKGVISESLETEIINGGHATERLSGVDLYDTNMAVVNKAGVESGTPVIVTSGEDFPDALSVSGFAGSNQYPILLVGKNYLSEKTQNYISTVKPSMVYIAGGASVVSQSMEEQIKALVPSTTIKRLAGSDRFDTAGVVTNEFANNPNTIYLSNGFDFADALAGSALAAKTGDPILLIDNNSETLPPAVEAYLKKLRDNGNHPIVRTLGGESVVSEHLIQEAQNILNGN